MQDQTSTWRVISVAPDYEVSNTGQVRNTLSGYLLKTTVGSGYPTVSVSRTYGHGPRKQYYVHRLVIDAFVGGPSPALVRPQVNHIDANKTNNNITNLEWVSHAGNGQHAYRMGLVRPPRAPRGEAQHSSRLTTEKVREIRNSDKSARRWARELGIGKTAILNVRARKTWAHVD